MTVGATLIAQTEAALLAALWAFVIAVVGYLVALVFEWLVKWAYRYFGIKDYMVSSGFERAVIGIEMETILRELVKWWVFLVFLVQAANFIQLYAVTYLFGSILEIYNLIALAIIYFAAGAIVAEYVGKKMEESKVVGGRFTVVTTKAIILYIALITALRLVHFTGIEFLNQLVILFVEALVIAFGLSMGIAFGLGGQDLARDILKEKKESIKKLFK